ncbi:hypothetical protein CPB84DRAFT_1846955 [Gymnopilus junonius]|uniref:General transcription and DNA repair factor IIH subunit TFB5 n=1 Tax=Gymnopilus junonius TaxID=109634 RepID=A0A9P5NR66_GYMJU|nr:hypothetical protein CPB84DRAFT_1846955 [Gymnopilus junonius]
MARKFQWHGADFWTTGHTRYFDDHHLVIKAEQEYRVRKELESELEKNTYSLES